MKNIQNNKKGVLVVVLFLVSFFAVAQQITLTGIVKDSLNNPLDMANVVAINDVTKGLDGFGITDEKGRYRINVNAKTTYALKVSYIGYQPKELKITTTENDASYDIVLKEQTEELDEVELTYEMPVTIKGDTIVYNTDSFVNGTEKKLADVLKNLPGVEVNDDGEIEVEGKKVTKLMVEGKDFFDGDSKLGAKNIPANAVDKVEVLRNFSEVSQMKDVGNNQDNVALNIKLKEGKKRFWFGEISGGIGLDERYLVHPKLFYYSPKYSINVLTDFNNIGEMPFTPRDYFNFTGGFRNIMQRGGTNFNVGSNSLGISVLQNDRAKEINTKFGAVNFSYTASEALDLSGFAIYSYTKTDLETLASRRFISTNQLEETTTTTNQKAALSLVKLSAIYKPSPAFQLDYDVLLKQSGQDELENTLSISDVTDNITEIKEQKPISINQNINIYKTLKSQDLITVEAQQLFSREDPFYEAIRSQQPFTGIVPLDQNQTEFNINQDKLITTNKFDVKGDYYWITGQKSNIDFTLGATYSSQQFDSKIFQILDNDTTLDFTQSDLNNDVQYTFSDIFFALHYKVISGKFTFNPGVTMHQYTAKNTQLATSITDNLFNIVPDVFLNYQLKKSEAIRLNYNVTREFTDISRFAQGYVFSNYNNLYQGNRALESALYHNVTLNFSSFNMFNFQNIFANLSYNKRIDAFKNNSSITGINQVGTTINSGLEDEIMSANVNYQRTFGKIKASARANVSYSKLNNVVNSAPRLSESLTQGYRTSFSTNFREWPNLEVGYNYSINNYNNGGLESTFYTESPFVRLDALFLKSFVFTADYDYYNYSDAENTINNEYAFLNTNLTYQKSGSKWEYGIKVTNLLNNTTINRDSFNDLFFSTSAYQVQPRFIMFNVKYDL